MTGGRRPHGQRGSAAVWVLCLAALLVAATTLAVLYGSAVAVRHRADAAADLSALAAAAQALAGPAAACAAAARIATANGAVLRDCGLAADVATVAVTVRGRGAVGEAMVATGRARAGPSDPAATRVQRLGEGDTRPGVEP